MNAAAKTTMILGGLGAVAALALMVGGKLDAPPSGAAKTPGEAISRDLDILARTLWGEARGEGDDGLQAVANVVMNRYAVSRKSGFRYWWGNSVEAICLSPRQFSCWNEDDSNRYRVLEVDLHDAVFKRAVDVAGQAINGRLADLTGGATNYHAWNVKPDWAARMTRTGRIKGHIFYRDTAAVGPVVA